ncbi:type II secretion system protein GspE [bacterium]|nr:type II secretion system protein GspE [bacterium]
MEKAYVTNDPVFSVLDKSQRLSSPGEVGPGQQTQAQPQRFGRKTLGEILVERKKITEEQLREALRIQVQRGGQQKVGQILLESELVDQTDILQGLAQQLELPYLDLLPINDIDAELVRDLSIGFCSQNLVMPISRDSTGVTVAVNDPLNISAVDDLRLILGSTIFRVVCPKSTIESAINNVFERQDMSRETNQGLATEEGDDLAGLEEATDLLHDTEDAPVRREVSTIIRRAISEKASDIHIEPFEDRVSVRLRVDGSLREVRTIPKKYQANVTTRIKILGKLNIAESRIPQDGRISLRVGGRDCDVRVSSLPTKFGERIVMRILDKSSGVRELSASLPEKVMRPFEALIHSKHGIVLVTGPTGSGKTSTLASSLMHINKPDVNIITVEDPVEVALPGVGQVEVNEKAGLTFAAGLRSILRQDPDVVLIGEIRDSETAQIAVQAAMTGHLVLSTLHTNDTASSVTRLADLGVEPFQITTTVLGVLAVRLMKRVCVTCRELTTHTPEELALLNLTPERVAGKKLYKARPNGCSSCKNLGYSGRAGIYELLVFDEAIRQQIVKSVDGAALRKIAMTRGMTTLRDSAAERFMNGETTLEEALQKTQVDD